PRGCSTDAAAAVAGGGIAAYGASAWAVVAACAPHPAVVASIMPAVISVVEARVVAVIVRAIVIGPVVVIVGVSRWIPGVPASIIYRTVPRAIIPRIIVVTVIRADEVQAHPERRAVVPPIVVSGA